MSSEQIIPVNAITGNTADVNNIRPNKNGVTVDVKNDPFNVTIELKPESMTEDVFTKKINISGNAKTVKIFYLTSFDIDYAIVPNITVDVTQKQDGVIEIKQNLKGIRLVFNDTTTGDGQLTVALAIHACFQMQGTKCYINNGLLVIIKLFDKHFIKCAI